MGKNRRRSRTMSLREAASVVFALVALLPILLLRLPALAPRDAPQHGGAARACSRPSWCPSSASWSSGRMVDQIAQLAQGFLVAERGEAGGAPTAGARRDRRGARPRRGHRDRAGPRRLLPHARRPAGLHPATRGPGLQAGHAQRDGRAGRPHPEDPGPAGPRAAVHHARGARHRRLHHDPRPRPDGAEARGLPRHPRRGGARGRGEGGRGRGGQGGGDGRAGAGGRHRLRSALQQDQQSPVRQRLVHLHADPGRRPRDRRDQHGQAPRRRGLGRAAAAPLQLHRSPVPERADDLHRLRGGQLAPPRGGAVLRLPAPERGGRPQVYPGPARARRDAARDGPALVRDGASSQQPLRGDPGPGRAHDGQGPGGRGAALPRDHPAHRPGRRGGGAARAAVQPRAAGLRRGGGSQPARAGSGRAHAPALARRGAAARQPHRGRRWRRASSRRPRASRRRCARS